MTTYWVSGDKFDGGNCVPGRPILILLTTFTIATCDSATVLHLTQIENVFTNLTYAFTDKCVGDCQNTVSYDTVMNPQPRDPYTRMTDNSSSCAHEGRTMFATVSGGDNDFMWSINEDYMGVVTSGGSVCILHAGPTGPGGALQVLNPGPPLFKIPGQFSFSKVTDTRYYLDRTGGHGCIKQGDFAADVSSTNEVALVDVTAPGVCPGLPQPFVSTSGSIINVSNTDDTYGFGLSNTGAQKLGSLGD